MEKKELELVSHPQIDNLNIFLVQMQSRAPHLHADLEIGLILKGCIELSVSGQNYTLAENEMYLLNSMTTHEIYACAPDTVILAMQISPHLINSYFPEFSNTCFVSTQLHDFFPLNEPHYDVLRALCIELAYSYFCHLQNYELKCIIMVNMVMYILRTFVPCRELTAEESQTLQHKASWIHRILSYTDEHCCQKLLLSDIARMENLSLTYLSHLFKEMLGINFQTYLNEKRFEHAIYLLENTNDSILDISLNCGFSDVRYLNRMFQSHCGCSPTEYRKSTTRKQPPRSENVSDTQWFYSAVDSISLLNNQRTLWHNQLRTYSLWDFFQ